MQITPTLIEQVAGACLRLGQLSPDSSPPPLTNAEWLTPNEAAGYLRLTSKALEHLRASRTGPDFHRYSGRVRYRVRDLRNWADAHAVRQSAATREAEVRHDS